MKFESSTKRVKIETKSQLFTQSVCADVVTFVVARSRSVETLLQLNTIHFCHTFILNGLLYDRFYELAGVMFRLFFFVIVAINFVNFEVRDRMA